MISSIGAKHLFDAWSERQPHPGERNDDLLAAEAARHAQRARRPSLAGRISGWLSRQARRKPETLDQAMGRLAAISPHLLDDIGMEPGPANRPGPDAADQGMVLPFHVLEQAERPAPRPAQTPVRIMAVAAE